LTTDNVSIFYLVIIALKQSPIYHTNAPFNIVIPALGSFQADNGLVGIDSPRLSSVVDRESYKITYSDSNFEFRDLFESGIIGTEVSVYIGFYNTTTANVNGTDIGKPFTDMSDLILAYQGFIDSHGHTTDVDGEVLAVLECSSPLASLDLVKPFYTSRDAMRQVNANDASFDEVYQGSKEINLLWGKK
jgi:hypothetical protein